MILKHSLNTPLVLLGLSEQYANKQSFVVR